MALGVLGDIAKGLVSPITDIIKEKVTDRDLQNELVASLQSQDLSNRFRLAAKRLELAMKQAENKSLFVSGARPGAQWICNLGMLYAFIIQPIFSPMSAYYLGFGLEPIPIEALMTAAASTLGLSGYRSREKRLGVAREGGARLDGGEDS